MKSLLISSNQKEEGEGKINIESTVNINGNMTLPEAILHLATSLQAISQTMGKLAKQLNEQAEKIEEEEE